MSGCLCLALRRATRAVTQEFDRALRGCGLRITQVPILVAATLMDAPPLGRLARVLGMERTTLLRNVRPLRKRGLVEVYRPEGMRHTVVRCTEAGRVLLGRSYSAWQKAQRHAASCLPGARWRGGLDALSAVGVPPVTRRPGSSGRWQNGRSFPARS
jgi:DNA-binding MarR family transcriptional regulator